jgi:hypothetical protein
MQDRGEAMNKIEDDSTVLGQIVTAALEAIRALGDKMDTRLTAIERLLKGEEAPLAKTNGGQARVEAIER